MPGGRRPVLKWQLPRQSSSAVNSCQVVGGRAEKTVAQREPGVQLPVPGGRRPVLKTVAKTEPAVQ